MVNQHAAAGDLRRAIDEVDLFEMQRTAVRDIKVPRAAGRVDGGAIALAEQRHAGVMNADLQGGTPIKHRAHSMSTSVKPARSPN